MENRQVIFKGFIERAPRETDMEFRVGSINGSLKAPAGSGAFLVKNLYLSCDPYMRGRMRDSRTSYIPPFVPGQVQFLGLYPRFRLAVISVNSATTSFSIGGNQTS